MDAAANVYHANDNSIGGILGGLVNYGVGIGTNLLTNAIVPKADAKQQTLKTPGEKPLPVPVKQPWNWKPWAIGGGVVVALAGLAFFIFRKPS